MPETQHHLKINAKLSRDKKRVSVEVVEQTHFKGNFGNQQRNEWWAGDFSIFDHNNVRLYSKNDHILTAHGGPKERLNVYLLGDHRNDNKRLRLRMSIGQYARFREAVKAYNEWGAEQANKVEAPRGVEPKKPKAPAKPRKVKVADEMIEEIF